MILEKLIAEIDGVTAEFIKYFANLTEQQLNSRKQKDQWTIAQCFQHIIIVNESYVPLITAVKEKRYKAGWNSKIGLLANYFGKNALQMAQPGNEKKLKTAPQFQPNNINPIDDIVVNFIAHQQSLKQVIVNSQDLLSANTVIHSPVNKMIVYKLSDVFKIMVAHEQRHLKQGKAALVMQYSEKFII